MNAGNKMDEIIGNIKKKAYDNSENANDGNDDINTDDTDDTENANDDNNDINTGGTVSTNDLYSDYIEFKQYVTNLLSNNNSQIENLQNTLTKLHSEFKLIRNENKQLKEERQNNLEIIENLVNLNEKSTPKKKSKNKKKAENNNESAEPRNDIKNNKNPTIDINDDEAPNEVIVDPPPVTVPKQDVDADPRTKITIVGDSHLSRIRKNIFRRSLDRKYKSLFNVFSGTKAERLDRYIIPTLEEDRPDVVLIHVGSNNVNPWDDLNEREIIANKIIKIGKRCREAGVKEVIISSILMKRDRRLSEVIRKVNVCLKDLCLENNFIYLSNCDVRPYHIGPDGIYLNHNGTHILASNFVRFLNRRSYNNCQSG